MFLKHWLAKILYLTLLPFAALALLSACRSDTLPAGIVATVNGEPISLHAVQTLLDSRMPAMGLVAMPSIEDARRNYGKALAILVANTLVRQELTRRGMAIDEGEVEKLAARTRADFGEEEMEKFLAEASLPEEDWLALLRDHLAMETFRSQVIQPGTRVELGEIRDYYQHHAPDFNLPESVHACFVAGADRDAINDWCAALATAPRREEPFAHCADVALSDIPQNWRQEVAALKPLTCAKSRIEDGEWRTMALISRERPRRVPLPEAYAMVERILLEQKCGEAFDRWLERAVANSRIMVSPEMRKCLADGSGNPDSSGEKSQQASMEDAPH